MSSENLSWYKRGVRNGFPIGFGYFSVSFALGIAAKRAGLTAFQATLASLLCNASAGEYAGFRVIEASGSYLAIATLTLIVNARYLLMSTALSQKLPESTPLFHRLGVGYFITDEIFGASVTVDGFLNPFYSYGLASSSLSFWALGTCLGVVTGNILPPDIVDALGVLLYGMFIAIIIPPARKSVVLAGIVLFSMGSSWAFSVLPMVSGLSEGTRIIILTLMISMAAAVLFPRDTDENEDENRAGSDAGNGNGN